MGNTHPSKNVIDLHGLTREESLVIVQDALDERASQVDRECSILLLLVASSVYIDLLLTKYMLSCCVPLLHPPTAARREAPLRIITGRGNHSAGNVSVLGPFLTNTLKAEGWSVHKVDGGIIVNNRTIGP